MKRIVIGILAHVDAGKTTLSEALLYATGSVRKLGRVDHGDAFLDTNTMERQRGITIFTEPAIITTRDLTLTLLDTRGTSIFRRKWNVPSPCSTMRSWSFPARTESKGIPKRYGDC